MLNVKNMQWKTALSKVSASGEIVRGYHLSDLMRHKDFVETIFLLLRGKLPNQEEAAMMNALFTAAIDHGVGVASTMSARLSASAGNSLHASLAAGILSLGERHGLAIEGAARFFQEHAGDENIVAILQKMKEQKKRVPGFGHRLLTHDKRAELLFTLAKENGVYGKHCIFAVTVGEELNKTASKKLPMNIDGAMAAIISDMGFDWRMAQGIFIIARVPGLVAHVYEEITTGEGLRRLEESEEAYVGPAEKLITE
jgi:citryl-CoA lyase